MAKKSNRRIVEPAVIPPIYATGTKIEVRDEGTVHVAFTTDLRDLASDGEIENVIVCRIILPPSAALVLLSDLKDELVTFTVATQKQRRE